MSRDGGTSTAQKEKSTVFILSERKEKSMDERLKRQFDRELRSTQRPGIESLITELENGGFYKAPCSTKYHYCEEGGLLKHSMNVLQYARMLNDAWGRLEPDDSIILVSLLHDLGKMGDHGKQNYIPKILKDGSQSEKEPYTTNKDLRYMDHEVRSIKITSAHIDLTEDEETAILWHNGLYGKFSRDIMGNEFPLYMLLHFADMWCSRVVEEDSENEGKEE